MYRLIMGDARVAAYDGRCDSSTANLDAGFVRVREACSDCAFDQNQIAIPSVIKDVVGCRCDQASLRTQAPEQVCLLQLDDDLVQWSQ